MQATMMQSSVGRCVAKAPQPQTAKNSICGTPVAPFRTALPARQQSRVVITASGITIPPIKKLGEPEIDDAVNAIRFLSIDGVNCAKSGHPGLPMG